MHPGLSVPLGRESKCAAVIITLTFHPELVETQRPALVVIAGPNGAGKTTLTESVLAHHWLEHCKYVNPDLIAEQEFGGWNDSQSVLRAAQEAERRREACLEARRSIAFETVLSTASKVDFVRRALASGFFVRLFFVGTDSPAINANRVAKRVIKGGHDVPISKIITRHGRSIANLGALLPNVDRGYVYDNSMDGESPRLVFRSVDGRLKKTYGHPCRWAEQVAELVWGSSCR